MPPALESRPAPSPHDVAGQLSALLQGVGVAPIIDVGWIRVTGSDRVRWLNGMVTNSIQSLAPGEGCYNFVLNAQGRIQGDVTAFLVDEAILLETSADQVKSLMTLLDRFIIMDDVELADISDERRGILIAGPDALRTVQGLAGAACASPPAAVALPTSITLKQTDYRGAPVDLIRAHSPVVPRFEIWGDGETMERILGELGDLAQVSGDALEDLRILEGTPRYGVDIRNLETARDLPQETGQTRALHFTKGCYLGQEIVERIHSRGSVHRAFSGFTLTGDLPAAGTALTFEGKAVGELTSVAAVALPAGTRPLALGYVRREALERGVPLVYPGGSATPSALPFPNL